MKKEKLKEQLNFNTQKLKNNKAITLIALVVTIVVLLILAGISISLVVGDNGLIRKSKDAKKQYEEAQANELAMTDEAGDLIDETVTGNLKGTKPYLPSEDYTKVPGTSLDNGLVIADKKGNEYVWVEVPKTDKVYATAGLKITEFSTEELDSINTDLINYVKDYRTPYYFDKWYSGCGIADLDTYTDKYNKMLKSVYQNGGFWIGRYEIGIDENTVRNFKSDTTTERSTEGQTPVIKKNKVPYNWITCDQAESLAETFAPSGYTSSLLFGLQWDLVLKHLETKGKNPGTSATSLQDAINGDSTDWGNYRKASFEITNTDAMYSIDDGASWKKVSEEADKKYQKESTENVLLTTGAEARNSMLNICDFAGNLWERTLEMDYNRNDHCACRGGTYYGTSDSSTYAASARSVFFDETDGDFYLGTRVTLY